MKIGTYRTILNILTLCALIVRIVAMIRHDGCAAAMAALVLIPLCVTSGLSMFVKDN